MNKNEISEQVVSWIKEEDLAVRADLKPVRKYDIYADMDDDEIEGYWDFISWYLNSGHDVLNSLPRQDRGSFFFVELDEVGDDVSAFNTADFQRQYHSRFDKYQYKIKKIFERVKDLAITHSCISHDEGKKNIHRRFRSLVVGEFRDRAIGLLELLKRGDGRVNRLKVVAEIANLNARIKECNGIWKQYAFWV